MALQNLTPQLRTRLSRVERLVGLFVTVATLLFLFGFGYYVYQTAQRKGWFLHKAPYFTFVDNAAGMREGDKVKLMGFEVGEITEITAMPPFDPWNVYVAFIVREPYYGYLWADSRARVVATDFLGGRTIEVTKGASTNGLPTYIFHELKDVTLDEARAYAGIEGWVFNVDLIDPQTSQHIVRPFHQITPELLDDLKNRDIAKLQIFHKTTQTPRIAAIYNDKTGIYEGFDEASKGYFLPPDESPALTERLEKVVNLVDASLPGILDLTNKLNQVLTNLANVAARTDLVLAGAQPILTNVQAISSQLQNPDGSLGQWLLPTNIRQQAEQALGAAHQTLRQADRTLTNAQSNLNQLSQGVLISLESLANLTSNLNAQVQANEFILTDLSDLIRNTDDMVQGLKRHWLLKGPFATPTNAGPQSILEPTLEPIP